MSAIILWLLGLVLIFIEFYIPGAIMGTIGAVLIVASLVLFILLTQNVLFIAIYIAAVVISVIAVIRFAMWKIPRTQRQKSIYSNDAQVGFVASTYDKSAIGKTGKVLSDLKPGGYISIDGKQHQAISETGYIVRGEEVEVIRGEGESLIVKKKGNK